MNLAAVKDKVAQNLATKMGAHLVNNPSLTDADLFAIGGEVTSYSEIIDTAIYMARRAEIDTEGRYATQREPSAKRKG